MKKILAFFFIIAMSSSLLAEPLTITQQNIKTVNDTLKWLHKVSNKKAKLSTTALERYFNANIDLVSNGKSVAYGIPKLFNYFDNLHDIVGNNDFKILQLVTSGNKVVLYYSILLYPKRSLSLNRLPIREYGVAIFSLINRKITKWVVVYHHDRHFFS